MKALTNVTNSKEKPLIAVEKAKYLKVEVQRKVCFLQMFEIYEDIGMRDPEPLVENLLRIFDKWVPRSTLCGINTGSKINTGAAA